MEKYRTLVAWQRAHRLALQTLRACDEANAPRSWGVFDQLKRAAVSVEANVVEGYALSTTPQFKRHLRIALGSAAEAEALIRLAIEAGYLDSTIGGNLITTAGDAIRTIQGLLQRPPPNKL